MIISASIYTEDKVTRTQYAAAHEAVFFRLEVSMGAAQKIDIHGEKGGSSKPKSPTEASDSLRSTNLAKLLIAVGEGEFDEVPTDYSFFLDNTPIRDASGNYNFPNVKWDYR